MNHDIKTIDGLVIATLRGELTSEGLTWLQQEALQVDRDVSGPLNRLIDMSLLEEIDLSFGNMENLAYKRALSPLAVHVKSALLAPKPLQFGFARMYQSLNRNKMIQIEIFKDRQSALDWLKEPLPPAQAKPAD